MGNIPKKTVAKPPIDRQPMCDNDILRLLADQGAHSVSEMAAHFHVTLTAIRNRLVRLTLRQSVTCRLDETKQRGRPRGLYSITNRGTATLAEAADEGIA